MILIQNGYMIDPKTGTEEECDILLQDGKVAAIGKSVPIPEGDCEILDGKGLVVAPGLVDVHVHFREPGFTHKEDIATGAAAAAKGGFTTVVLMANTKPTVDCEDTLSYVLQRGAETAIRVLTCANVTKGMQGKELVPMEQLAKAGAVGFTDDGIPLLDAEIVRRAMKKSAELDLPISFHEEDPTKIGNNGINRGKASEYYGIAGSPREAEISLVERDLELAAETGASINIQHISAKESVELVRKAKRAGYPVHAEATPHHFTMTEDAVIKYGSLAKMNPPLREEADRIAIIKGLQDGTIDMIATDHAPHTVEEKRRTITEAPSGIIGLETALALGITELVEPEYLSMQELLRLMSTNPAELYHLDAGYLRVGGPADLVIFDPKEKDVVKEFASKASNSPFIGWELMGKVKYTICNGKIAYRRDENEKE